MFQGFLVKVDKISDGIVSSFSDAYHAEMNEILLAIKKACQIDEIHKFIQKSF
ncbi:MAG: hypothetical protein P1P64_03455 [Treponemataceae bacterium]